MVTWTCNPSFQYLGEKMTKFFILVFQVFELHDYLEEEKCFLARLLPAIINRSSRLSLTSIDDSVEFN